MIFQKQVERVVQQTADRILADVRKDVEAIGSVLQLRKELEQLKLEKERIEEGHTRKEREIEHKVGLHNIKVEQEIKLAKREAKIQAEEEHLAQKEETFDERMEFFKDQLDSQVDYLKGMMKDILKRLPSAEILASIGGRKDS